MRFKKKKKEVFFNELQGFHWIQTDIIGIDGDYEIRCYGAHSVGCAIIKRTNGMDFRH